MNRSACSAVVMAAGMAGAAMAGGDTVKLTYLPTGAMPKIGGYMPQKIEMSTEKPAGVTKAPEAAGALYGVIEMGPGPTKFVVMVDEPDGQPAKMYFDANGNGDLTDDGATEWAPRDSGRPGGPALTMWMGGATAKVPFAKDGPALDAHLGMYRFDKNDPDRAALKNTLLYYSDYAYDGQMKLGEETYHVMLTDDLAKGDFRGTELNPAVEGDRSGVRLLIDVNGNGRFDSRGEGYEVRKAFNIKGVTYAISAVSASGAEFQVGVADEVVAEIKPPPDLSAGHKAIAFKAEALNGKLVQFPETYAGKVVLLDFWATWCGPCVAELPNVVENYKKYHGQGFEVLGVTLDGEGDGDKVKEFAKEHEMEWAQVFDGGGWKAAVAQLYGIDSIPRAMLVDGDTGEILADGVRGEKLGPAIEAALAKKSGKH